MEDSNIITSSSRSYRKGGSADDPGWDMTFRMLMTSGVDMPILHWDLATPVAI